MLTLTIQLIDGPTAKKFARCHSSKQRTFPGLLPNAIWHTLQIDVLLRTPIPRHLFVPNRIYREQLSCKESPYGNIICIHWHQRYYTVTCTWLCPKDVAGVTGCVVGHSIPGGDVAITRPTSPAKLVYYLCKILWNDAHPMVWTVDYFVWNFFSVIAKYCTKLNF